MSSEKKSVVFALTPEAGGGRIIDPRNPTATSGGGGSRAGFMGLVRAVGRLGKYDVTALSTFPRSEDVVDGVRYVQHHRAEKIDVPDVHFAYYDVSPLTASGASLRIASHHSCWPFGPNWLQIDVNTAPCDWAVDYLRKLYRPVGRWAVLPNSVEGLDGVAWAPEPGKIVYHTSPDRGLHRLLRDVYPEVKKRVPHASLDVVGDLRGVTGFANNPNLRGYEVERAKATLAGLKASEAAGGLKLHGRLSRPALLKLLASASCFAFPAEVNAPCETWSISVHECLAIGVPVVLSPVDALESLWSQLADIVERAPNPDSYEMEIDVDAFVEHVVRVLTDEGWARALSYGGKKGVAGMTFDESAVAFDRIVESFFESATSKPSEAAAE